MRHTFEKIGGMLDNCKIRCPKITKTLTYRGSKPKEEKENT